MVTSLTLDSELTQLSDTEMLWYQLFKPSDNPALEVEIHSITPEILTCYSNESIQLKAIPLLSLSLLDLLNLSKLKFQLSSFLNNSI